MVTFPCQPPRTMQLIAVSIHNNLLGKCQAVSSEEEGRDLIKSWAENQFHRPLTLGEEKDLEEFSYIYNASDPENIFTFSLGIVE